MGRGAKVCKPIGFVLFPRMSFRLTRAWRTSFSFFRQPVADLRICNCSSSIIFGIPRWLGCDRLQLGGCIAHFFRTVHIRFFSGWYPCFGISVSGGDLEFRGTVAGGNAFQECFLSFFLIYKKGGSPLSLFLNAPHVVRRPVPSCCRVLSRHRGYPQNRDAGLRRRIPRCGFSFFSMFSTSFLARE